MIEAEAIKRIEDHMRVHRIGEYPHIHLKEAMDLAIQALLHQEQEKMAIDEVIFKLKQLQAEVNQQNLVIYRRSAPSEEGNLASLLGRIIEEIENIRDGVNNA